MKLSGAVPLLKGGSEQKHSLFSCPVHFLEILYTELKALASDEELSSPYSGKLVPIAVK